MLAEIGDACRHTWLAASPAPLEPWHPDARQQSGIAGDCGARAVAGPDARPVLQRRDRVHADHALLPNSSAASEAALTLCARTRFCRTRLPLTPPILGT